MEIYRTVDGSEIAVVAATWELHKKITFDSLTAEFKSNPVQAWRNYGSVVKQNIESAIKDPNALVTHVNTSREHPWDDVRKKFKEWFRGVPGNRYFAHFDLSVRRDATGFGLVHKDFYSGKIIVDCMIRVPVPTGRDINFAELRQVIYDLTDRGFVLELVSYDQFQSEETRQILTEKGYKTDHASADKDTTAYDTLIELLLTDKLDYYVYEPFRQEMEELKLVNGMKYDHPKKNRKGGPGSKDVSDGVACSSMKCLEWHREQMEDRPAPGFLRINRSSKNWMPKYGD